MNSADPPEALAAPFTSVPLAPWPIPNEKILHLPLYFPARAMTSASFPTCPSVRRKTLDR